MDCVCAPVCFCRAIGPPALLCFSVCLTSHMFTGFTTGTAATLYLPTPSTRMIPLFVRPSSLSSLRSGALCAIP